MSKDLNEYILIVTINKKERSNLFFYYKDRENTSQIEAMLEGYESSLVSGIPFMLMAFEDDDKLKE